MFNVKGSKSHTEAFGNSPKLCGLGNNCFTFKFVIIKMFQFCVFQLCFLQLCYFNYFSILLFQLFPSSVSFKRFFLLFQFLSSSSWSQMPQADVDLSGVELRREVHLFRIEGFRVGDVGPENGSEVGKTSGRQKGNWRRSRGPLHNHQHRCRLVGHAISGKLFLFNFRLFSFQVQFHFIPIHNLTSILFVSFLK